MVCGIKVTTFQGTKIRDGDFADFSAFADFFFSASNLPYFCGFPQFRAFRTFLTLIRERERNAEKKILTK